MYLVNPWDKFTFQNTIFSTTFQIVKKPGRECVRCLTQSEQPWSNQEIRVIGIIHEGQIHLRGEVIGVCHVDYVLRVQLSTNYIVLRLL